MLGSYVTFRWCISLCFSWWFSCCLFSPSDFPCFCWPWQFWGILVRCPAAEPYDGICLMFYSLIQWVLCFKEEEHRVKVPFLSHIKGIHYPRDFSLLALTLIATRISYYASVSSRVKYSFPPSPTVLFGRKSLMQLTPSWVGGVMCCSWRTVDINTYQGPSAWTIYLLSSFTCIFKHF